MATECNMDSSGKTLDKSSRQEGFIISFLIIGLGVGWLMGLSVSHVVSIVISSIIGVITTILTVICGIAKPSSTPNCSNNATDKLKLNTSPLPITFLIIGIVIGSATGIYFRTHNLLGNSLNSEIKIWSKATGINEKEIAKRFFNIQHPKITKSKNEPNDKKSDQGFKKTVLFNEEGVKEIEEICNSIKLGIDDNEIRSQLKYSDLKELKILEKYINDNNVLKNVIIEWCKNE